MAATKEDLRKMCEHNNWGVGTQLRRTDREGNKHDMEITGFGENVVIIKYLANRIEGEAFMYYSEGDTFEELLSKDRILVEVINLADRMKFLLQKMTPEKT